MQENSIDTNKTVSNTETLKTTEEKNIQDTQTQTKPTTEVIKKKKRIHQKKTCLLCRRAVMNIDYKNVTLLKSYLKKNNKIVSHKITGNCLKHQHQIKNSIKRARILALLPFIGE